MKRILTWSLALLAAAAALVLLLRPQPVEVEAVRASRAAVEAFITEEAETRLDDDYVIAIPVAGRLLRIDRKEGALVEKGDVVARVDTFERRERLKELEARVGEIRALIVGVDEAKPKPDDIRAAELAVQEAKLRHDAARKALEAAGIDCEQERKLYERRKILHKEGSIPKTEFIEAERRYLLLEAKCQEAALNEKAIRKVLEQAQVRLKRLRESVDDNEFLRTRYQAQIRQIEAQEAVLRDELAKSEIRAPVTGPILEKYQEDEQVLAAGTPLLKIGDLASIRVESDILSEEVGRVRAGQDVRLFGPAVGPKPVAGKVARIYPSGFEKISSLGIEQQRVKVIMKFDNSELRLRPGVRLDVRIITDRADNALRVPERALFKTGGRWHLFAVRDGRAQAVPVEPGIRNDEWAQIVDGLAEGALVIPDPPPDLKDGSLVDVTVAD
jgi:HlyD family secretion protein